LSAPAKNRRIKNGSTTSFHSLGRLRRRYTEWMSVPPLQTRGEQSSVSPRYNGAQPTIASVYEKSQFPSETLSELARANILFYVISVLIDFLP